MIAEFPIKFFARISAEQKNQLVILAEDLEMSAPAVVRLALAEKWQRHSTAPKGRRKKR